jgi:hypothetical protein
MLSPCCRNNLIFVAASSGDDENCKLGAFGVLTCELMMDVIAGRNQLGVTVIKHGSSNKQIFGKGI